jgi:DNA-binding MarR family transcriptional regulator
MFGMTDEKLADSASLRLAALGERLTRALGRRLESVGLTPRQAAYLAALEEGPLSQRDIAGALSVAPSLVVTLTDQLSASGAVTRTRGEADRRVQLVALTDHGRDRAAAAAIAAAAADADFTAGLSQSARLGLDVLLAELGSR